MRVETSVNVTFGSNLLDAGFGYPNHRPGMSVVPPGMSEPVTGAVQTHHDRARSHSAANDRALAAPVHVHRHRDPADVPAAAPHSRNAAADIGEPETRAPTRTQTIKHSPKRRLQLRAEFASPLAGIPKARVLLSLKKRETPVPPPTYPTEAALDALAAPHARTDMPESLSAAQLTQHRSYITRFAAGLPTSTDKRAFLEGRRLQPETRAQLLASLSPDEIAAKGLRYSDGQSPFRDDERHRRIRSAPSIVAGSHWQPDHKALLADLWYYADPLLLDHTADAWANGVNLGYEGPFTTQSASNMSHTTEELQNLADLWVTEVLEGRARGFFPLPPFINYHTIPAGLVPKQDGTMRPVDNYSVHGAQSINANSDKVRPQYPRFEKGIANLRAAGRDGLLASWDVEKAYQNHRVRACDQWLTVARFPWRALAHRPDMQAELTETWRQSTGNSNGQPGYVYAYRTHCPFGLAVSGYRWDVNGGKVVQTAYIASQHRLYRDRRTGEVMATPHIHFPNANGHDALIASMRYERACITRSDDTILHPIGARRLQLLTARRDLDIACKRRTLRANLEHIGRNVDDFIKGFPGKKALQSKFTLDAIVFTHMRLGIRLKTSKFTGLTKAVLFNGFALIVPDTIAFPHGKRDKLLGKLARVQHSVVQYSQLESAIGSCIYLSMMFPQARGVMAPLYACLYASNPAAIPGSNTQHTSAHRRKKAVRKANMSREALSSIRFFKRVLREGPVNTSAAVRSIDQASRANAIMHTDWAAQRSSDKQQGWGGVLFSSGKWASSIVPPEFVASWGESSPAMEAWAVWAMLRTFSNELRFKAVLVFSDNMPFIQAYDKYNGHHRTKSPGLAIALRAIAFELVRTSSLLFLEYVDTTSNIADPASRDDIQALELRIGSLNFSEQFSRVEVPSLHPPSC